MLDSEVTEEDLLRVPRLVLDCDPVSLELSPTEGFLLSRIDGQTSWKLLREIGAQTPSEVDQCIEEWLMLGVIDIDGRITADFAGTLRGNIFFKSNNILCCAATPSCRT